jgi:hypothetical protein
MNYRKKSNDKKKGNKPNPLTIYSKTISKKSEILKSTKKKSNSSNGSITSSLCKKL